ncbi:hypothetical protein PC9H_007809 [Pleurotus ostreatus]|uniref:Tail specific protease domain-containing protein n=1 Tax=Pleurotus ostreatus TaxID=5322 RepID=A0A8H7DUL3_PLEOS|nr:uncharacterized protein PC9H_007809 [Pleurotus ostreatus]KAF7428583.1 hypothetical protein PC9H_007809 [Pleurotus ostreatus]KAJ8696752.1 hypothetical protein PTI98_006595 [Pleurotus ostreatus]
MVSLLVLTLAAGLSAHAKGDPCAEISGKKWVSPREVRACFTSFPVEPLVKANIIEVLNKTLAFHTSVNYQIQAPEPFARDVHEDLHTDLARINNQNYSSDFELHVDLFRTFKRVNDGHCAYINYCYDASYITYLPTPLVLLTNIDGSQSVHIAPEAFNVSSTEFGSEVEFWQQALPRQLKGKLSSLSGARVLLIDGNDPFSAVNANALTTGSYQSFGTRQNSFFSSYSRTTAGWNYTMGNFAQRTWPDADNVTLTLQLENSTEAQTILLPYRSRISASTNHFTNSSTYRGRNCVAVKRTNGYDEYAEDEADFVSDEPSPIARAQQQPLLDRVDARKHHLDVLLDSMPLSDVALPTGLRPPLAAVNGSSGVSQFYMMKDNSTGVLVLGSFSSSSFSGLQKSLLRGLLELRGAGASRLIVDVTNNGGGYICIAHWLHRIIIGPKPTTEPQAGLDSTARAGPLARRIVKEIKNGADPREKLLYNPAQWTNGTHHRFKKRANWMSKAEHHVINGHEDSFSQRLGQECQPFDVPPPNEALFHSKDVVIVSNGRCASSCSLFSITMSKLEGVRTVVVGGKRDVPQQYCGTVGGQSTDFSTIDTEIKTAKLKNHPLAPPDFLTNSVQGITWRLGFGIDDPTQPEEWQDHAADFNLPLTKETVNNPVAIWKEVIHTAWPEPSFFVQGL